ncbi:MAG: archaeal proteasome endopeptidase complex subunit beta [Crenarchaeota archaeon]|nr:archaeal proteasome endopeptidase complex subunit beta [Thermoproteota archaeon]
MAYERLLTGATAIGLKLRDAVVLAAEKRVSYGGYVMSRSGKKVFKVSDRVAIAAAGLFADMQTISRILSAEIRYRELLTSTRMRVRSIAKLLSTILYSYKYFPFLSEVLVGGVDDDGPHLFVLDFVGSLIEDDYAAVGTGASIAIGIIESEYSPEMSIEKARDLAVKAIKAAASRDVTSGDGIDLAIVTRDRVQEEFVPLA